MNPPQEKTFNLEDLQRLQDELLDLNDYAHAIVNTVRQSIITLDKDLRVFKANRHFYEAFQVSEDVTAGRPIYELGNGQWNIPELRYLLEDCLPAKKSIKDYKVEHDFETIGPRIMIINAYQLEQKKGKDPLILLAIDDITERHRSEERLKVLSEDLKRSNTDLEQFAQIASHDIQEPLKIVNNYVQLLQKKGPNDQSSEKFLNIINKEISYVQALVQGLLRHAKINQTEKEFEEVDCNDCLESALGILQIVISESGGQVISERLPVISGDRVLITRLFQNLISNAIKFKSQDEPRIHVEARLKGDFWEISFTDNGIGIEPENLQKIFGVFNRVDKRYPGSGIGLSECKKIVERHGGEISLRSVYGQGSTFSVTFPR